MYVVGYPKSGNTWCCYLLAYCLNSEYDDIDSPGIHPRGIYRKCVKGGLKHPSYQKELGKIMKTHRLKLPDERSEKVIYLVRDARDVMVSFYFYMKNISEDNKDTFIKSLFKKFFRKEDISDFSGFLKKRLPDWKKHVKLWLKKDPDIILKYEELSQHPEKTLKKVFRKLEVEIPETLIREAIDIFSFNRMAKRNAGEENQKSFFRKGIVGDWVNHFSQEDISYYVMELNDIRNICEYLEYPMDNLD